MDTLLIILLSTVLIQGSAIALGNRSHTPHVRGVLVHEFRSAVFTLLTITSACLLGYALSHAWLPALHLDYLLTPLLLLCNALIFFVVRSALRPTIEVLHWPHTLSYLTTQCALFGMALFSAHYAESWLEALNYGLCSALTLALLSACFNALRERIELNDVPAAFAGIPIALITGGFIALALLGFAGMVRN